MKVALHEFCLKVDAPVVTEAAANYRPSTWPPARDWPVVIDKDGTVVSRWGDPVWDITLWAGTPTKLNFGDGEAGQSDPLDAENADLLRLAMGWLIWGPRAYRAPGTIKNRFTQVRAVVALCSQNEINAASLMRFPKVLERLPDVIASSKWEETIAVLHRLYDAREALGFTIVDATALKRLAEVANDHVGVQTPYIPPRIWVYQVARLRECLDDFLAHRSQVEACFKFCLDAYIANFGSLAAALTKGKDADKGPFTVGSERRPGCKYLGPFAETGYAYGIDDLLRRWVVGWQETRVSMFSSYLSLVSFAGLAYIANFTLQRKEEAASLRTSCLQWERDEKLGRVPIICGETTKTDPDADARWVASPSVEMAVEVLTSISRLRMMCDAENPEIQPAASDLEDPYLFSTATEPWGFGLGRARPYDIRVAVDDLKGVMQRYPLLLDEEQLRITSEDLKIARRLTPNLPEEEFAVGKVWPLAWHQYRRTGAVNMFASGVISDSSMQQQMKHSTRLMPLYYGQGHTRLHLNEEVEQAVVKAMYESMAHRLKNVVSGRFVSPHSAERKDAIVVNVLSAKDVKTLTAWAKAGKVSFRENRLGGCMKAGPCEYGGVESVARCGGGDGGKPCSDVLYDRENVPQVRAQLHQVTAEMEQLAKEHPRYAALAAERQAMENYLNVISAAG
ncbi:hypothetical protein [Burkholderia pseudomallei]|uniref:hypothetical protein n=1 Tax=Burkholderia pseudomallei TaxID=28450 RepID=UPI0022DC1335|nr:hypothetical protein [Burkholderia pseudomallei]MDA0558331.1 hypothetical protein [Burkholderia pseudomallei]